MIAAETPWIWGYCPYYNPYYTAPVVIENTTIDYSQPLALAESPAAPQSAPASFPATTATRPAKKDGAKLVEQAREAFAEADYSKALDLVNSAIAASPADPLLHQFRALTLFAQEEYQEAAACLYAALSVGPGWDWATQIGFYSDAETYTEQLRTLEQYVRSHPDAADARFVVAVHYLTCGYDKAAKTQLETVVKLNPKDQLSARLLRSLAPPQTPAAPAPALVAAAEPAAPVKKLALGDLTGRWNAQPADGTSIVLELKGDSQYSWQVTRQGKTQKFDGSCTLADNILILKQGASPAMVGQVAMPADGSLTFQLAGDNSGDPGLTFHK